MKKSIFIQRYKTQAFIILVCFVIILAAKLYLNTIISEEWISFLINLTTAITAGIVVGIYFDLSVRRELTDEILSKIRLKEELIKSGLVEYHSSWTSIKPKLPIYFNKAKKVDIYANYASTVLNDLDEALNRFLQIKKNEINIYILHDKNPFIPGLGAHWGFENEGTDEERIRQKISSSIETLRNVCKELSGKNKLKAKIGVYQLTRHPVFYSFYRFDNLVVFVPSKIVQAKSFKPMSFVAINSEYDDDLYKRCSAELEDIKLSKDAITKVFEYNKN